MKTQEKAFQIKGKLEILPKEFTILGFDSRNSWRAEYENFCIHIHKNIWGKYRFNVLEKIIKSHMDKSTIEMAWVLTKLSGASVQKLPFTDFESLNNYIKDKNENTSIISTY